MNLFILFSFSFTLKEWCFLLILFLLVVGCLYLYQEHSIIFLNFPHAKVERLIIPPLLCPPKEISSPKKPQKQPNKMATRQPADSLYNHYETLNRSAICLIKLWFLYLTIPMCTEARTAALSTPPLSIHSSPNHSLKMLLFERVESLPKKIPFQHCS